MSGGFLARPDLDAEARARARKFANALYGWRHDHRIANARVAACHLRVGPQFYADAEQGRTDPLEVGPATALELMQRTGLSAEVLGFDDKTISDPAGAESASEPLPAGPSAPAAPPAARGEGAPALSPPRSAGAPVHYQRHSAVIGAHYEAPMLIVLRIGGNEVRLGELLTRLTIDEAEAASAALAQAAAAGRRAHARAAEETR